MLQKLDLRLFGLRFISVVICLLGLMRIIIFILLGNISVHIFGPGINRVIMGLYEIISEMIRARFGWENELLISFVAIWSLLGSVFYVICGVFLFLRKSSARKAMIFFTLLILLNSLTVRVLTHTFTVDFNTVYFFIFNIMLLLYFTNKSVIALFCPRPKLNPSK